MVTNQAKNFAPASLNYKYAPQQNSLFDEKWQTSVPSQHVVSQLISVLDIFTLENLNH